MFSTIIIPIACVVLLLFIVIFFKSTYLTAPPNKALIISGFRKSSGKPRVVIGGSTIRIPFLERVDEIALDLIQVDIKTSSSVPTSEYININYCEIGFLSTLFQESLDIFLQPCF